MTDQPGYPPEQVLRGLSIGRRIGYAAAGLGGLAGVVLIGMLWATEPAPLPVRTQLAFAALIGAGAAWAGFAGWALVRRPLFAVDRLIAAVLAVTFSTLTAIGAALVAMARSSTAGLLVAAGIGLVMVAAAVGQLRRAQNHRAALLARKRELEVALVPAHEDTGAADQDRPASHDAGTMKTRSGLPIGPLALAMRHRRGGLNHRGIAVIASIIGVALVAGVALLLL
jgi:hypothetical protein